MGLTQPVQGKKEECPVFQLNRSMMAMGDSEMVKLAETIKRSSTFRKLEELWLNDNNIADEGARALADALRHNTTIDSLSLVNNNIGDEGVKALADTLGSNTSLRTLWMESNRVGDRGCGALAKALCTNSKLEVLELRGNSIGDEGAKALGEALRFNSSLTKLMLANNAIGVEGVMALLYGLHRGNSSLDVLDLTGNGIDVQKEEGKLLMQLFDRRPLSIYKTGVQVESWSTLWERCKEVIKKQAGGEEMLARFEEENATAEDGIEN